MSKVIVVGGGLSGLSAAHTLYERGANVLVLDKNPFFGGNSTKATSGINGAGTRGQADLGIPDTAKQFEADTTKSARDLARPDLIRVLTYQSGAAVNWLVDHFGLDLTKVSRLGGHSQPRTHRGGAQFPGMTITYAQMEKLEELAESDPERVKIVRKARVTKLIKENDAVVGVEYTLNGQTLKELGPVILATGGYAADFDESESGLLKKYRPELLKLSTTNGDHCTGDGQKMIAAIGGKLIDLEKVQVHPTGLVDPKDPEAKVKFLAAEALRGVGGLLLDNEGNRFADELGHRDYVTGRMWDNNKFPVRLILNSKSGKEIEWHCKHYQGRGLMKHFESGAALAKEMGISEDKLAATFADYRAIAKGEKKDPFGKKFFQHPENFTMEDNFWVAHMQPVLHYTMGGARIDPASRVLDNNEKPIPGLFACGELGGGVHGANRLGGSSLLGCVVFGRVAGDSAAAYLLNGISTGKIASARAGQIQQHLETRVRVDPASQSLNLTFSWAGEGSSAGSSVAQQAGPVQTEAAAQAATTSAAPAAESQAAAPAQKEYTLEEVAKHNTKEDIWIAVNGQVLDVTNFLSDHPGGEPALLLYAGKEASEEFNMMHDPKVVEKYAKHTIVGTYKA
ncbi:Osmotic growth protein [Tilletia horrida]|uniref:fumarate reductase (NADH) n=1 Tax=Tilletia horrida TaxID=155126 RepID=A0AAN6G871_9BASI|nr:Osmotic growth protein [Tilletia horrida]KAK0524072.1 Osmotic growth protein [Tilletia horrida]KAK0533134.1 Osmotic growth protein [Tilletia horrida]KAK0544611.1 Osmotic growth protein [Tilletia horrida]